jgi:hypothetical protein
MTTSNNHDEYAAAAARPRSDMKPYLKALGGAAAAFAGSFGAATGDGVTAGEWSFILGSTIAGAFLVFFTPYKSTNTASPAK